MLLCLGDRRHAGQLLALQELERGATARGHPGHAVGELELVERAHRVPAADHGIRVRPGDGESDGDGRLDRDEGTGDADADGLPNYLDPDDADGPNADPDHDGLLNAVETGLGTDPYAADTDGDGLNDYRETDAGQAIDTDRDGRIDAVDGDSDGDSDNYAETYANTEVTAYAPSSSNSVRALSN